MKYAHQSRILLILSILLVPAIATAESHQESLYVSVDCMQSQNSDYLPMEMEIWQPMHQARINKGHLESWALYWVLYGDRSDCDFFTVNSYRGLDQLNSEANFEEIFASVHGEEGFEEAMARTEAARKHAGTNLWVLIDSVAPAAYKFAVVNGMRPDNADEYMKMEVETWKPVHSALARKGITAGWGLYRLFAPRGESQPYEFATVDMLNRLGPVEMQETIEQVHSGKSLAQIMEKAEATRTVVDSETWMLIASVASATESE